jgi:fibronectin type 3 domain-containing protein
MRIYVVRGVTRSGRAGPPSVRVQIPVVTLPPAPGEVSSRVTETAVALGWKPPAEAPSTLAFNVYRADTPLEPLNPSPLTAPAFEVAGVKFGEKQCFRVRSVLVSKNGPVEGGLSEEECVTPTDVFPPATPATPNAVPTPGEISLIWDSNKEKDVAGYLVLRGEAPDGMLQPLTPVPIRETAYRDTTVKPGVRYIYAIVAVDEATPPNASPQSARVEETAR